MVLGLDGPLHAQLSNLHGQRIWGPLDIHVLNTESGRLVGARLGGHAKASV